MTSPRCVLITGATGGVGRFAIQLARESGAHVTALVRDAAASGELIVPSIPDGCEPAYHIYYLRFASGAARDAAAAFVRARGIEASSHFVPLHLSSYAQRELGTRPGECPITERAANTLLRLPLYPSLAAADQDLVVDAVFAFLGHRRA